MGGVNLRLVSRSLGPHVEDMFVLALADGLRSTAPRRGVLPQQIYFHDADGHNFVAMITTLDQVWQADTFPGGKNYGCMLCSAIKTSVAEMVWAPLWYQFGTESIRRSIVGQASKQHRDAGLLTEGHRLVSGDIGVGSEITGSNGQYAYQTFCSAIGPLVTD